MTARASTRKLAAALLLIALAAPILAPTRAARAEDYPGAPPSPAASQVEWQALSLEESLRARLNSELLHLIPQNYFLVSVSVSVLPEPVKPKLPPRAEPSTAPAADALPLLLENLSNFSDDRPLGENGNPPAEPPRTIFNAIKNVEISVWLDKLVPADKEQIIRKLVASSTSVLPRQRVRIRVEKHDLATPPPAPSPSPVASAPPARKEPTPAELAAAAEAKKPPFQRYAEKAFDIAQENSVGLGMILAALFLCLTASALIKGIRALYARHVDVLDQANAQRQREFEAAEARREAEGSASAPGPTAAASEDALSGARDPFEQVREMIRGDAVKAARLIRQIIATDAPGAREALMVLSRVAEQKELEALLGSLSAEEVRSWRSAIGITLNDRSRAVAERFLGTTLLKNTLMKLPRMDARFRDLLASITPVEFVHCAKRDRQAGAILLNLLPSETIATGLGSLPPLEAVEVTRLSMTFDETTIAGVIPLITSAVAELRARASAGRTPFVDAALEILPKAAAEVESVLFEALAMGGPEALLAAAKTSFPTQLVPELPADILRSALLKVPVKSRSEALFVQEAYARDRLLAALGEPGSSLRDMVDSDLDALATNPARAAEVTSRAATHRRALTDSVRALLRTDATASVAALAILETWVATKSSSGYSLPPSNPVAYEQPPVAAIPAPPEDTQNDIPTAGGADDDSSRKAA